MVLHDVCGSTLLLDGDLLYACTSNAIDDRHDKFPQPDLPSLIVLEKKTGRKVRAKSSARRCFITDASMWPSALDSSLLRFLKDRRVTFFPFAGADPDEQVVIDVRLARGLLVEGGHLTATQGEMTQPPK